MLKKLALYSILFIVVALTTAAGVVVFNKTPQANNNSFVLETAEPTALSSVMSAAMNIDSYTGSLKIYSTDKTIDVVGSFTLSDLSQNPKANVFLEGQAFGKSFVVNIKYIDEYIYVLYNNALGLKVAAKDLTDKQFIDEIVGIASNFIKTDSVIDFDTDKILASLNDVEEKETEKGFSISISLPDIGEFIVETDKDYIPTSVTGSNIKLFGKTISLDIHGSQGAISSITTSNVEENDYIDVSSAKSMLSGVIKTLKQMPFVLSGKIVVFGQSIDLSVFVDNNLNMVADVSYANISAKLTYFNDYIYADICGAKLIGTFDELMELFGAYSGVDVERILSELSIRDSGFTVAGVKVDFEFFNNYITKIQFAHNVCSGEFNVQYLAPCHVASPSGYRNAITFTRATEIINSYINIFESNKVSFKVSGSLNYKTEIPFSLACYINHNDLQLENAFLGGSFLEKSLYVYYKDEMAYVSYQNNKVKFSDAFAKNIFAYVRSLFDVELPEINYLELAKEQLQSLEISYDATTINIVLECGLTVDIFSKTNKKEIVIKGNAFGCQFDCLVELFDKGNHFESAFNTLTTFQYTDISGLDSVATSVASTVLSENSKYKGTLTLNLLGVVGYEIGVEVEINNLTKDYEVAISLTNLPTTALVTDTTTLNFSSQRLEIVAKQNTLFVKRYAKGLFTGKEYVRLDKTYTITDLNVDSVFEMFGIGGIFGGKIKDAAKNASSSQKPTSSNILSYVKLFKLNNGLLVSLSESVLPSSLEYIYGWVETSNNQLSSIHANGATKEGTVSFSLNLQKV